MPVLSPRRSSSSALNGSYRNTFGTSNLDRPYYGTNSYSPRINSYSERFTTRSYIDSDGRRVVSRQGSITEDGVTTRFKEELREPSVRRDSLSWDSCIGSVRENSILDTTPSRYERENSLTRSVSREARPALSAINVADSVAELHKKYSPANYVPACRRKNENISRSKSINDIGKPPFEKNDRKKVNNGVNCNNGLSVCNNTNSSDKLCDNALDEDDNGNRASVAEIRKKFDQKPAYNGVNVENGDAKGDYEAENKGSIVKIGDKRFKKSENTKTDLGGIKVTESRFKRLEDVENGTKIGSKKSETVENGLKVGENQSKKSEIEGITGNSIKVGENWFKKSENVESEASKENGVKISENRFKKLDNAEKESHNKEKGPKIGDNRSKKLDLDTARPRVLKVKIDKPTSKIEKSESPAANDVTKTPAKSPADLETPEKATLKTTSQKVTTKKKPENKETNQENFDSKIDSSRCMPENGSKTKFGEVSEVLNDGVELRGGKSEVDVIPDSESSLVSDDGGKNCRITNFASYIPSADFLQGDVEEGSATDEDQSPDASNDMEDQHVLSDNSRYILHRENSDVSSPTRLSRMISAQNTAGTSTATTASVPPSDTLSSLSDGFSQSSLDRHHARDHLDGYGRPSAGLMGSTVRNAGLNGLKNIGNTCFMNSVLQCLSNTRPLLEYVKNDAYLSDINTTISGMKGALIKAFAQVIKELWSDDSSDRVVNTLALKSQIQRFAPRFMGYAQQDAQEFLRYLLEGLHEDVNRVTTKPKSIHTEIDEKLSDSEKSSESWRRYLRMDNSKIVDIFVGQLKSTLRCTHCGHCSVTFDPFWDLSLPIPQRAGPLRLQQCLDCFTREETLDGDEKPTCSKCKERRKCTKSFSIQKFPKILVIHLKRFSPTERYRGKLSLTIDFPTEGLDMQNYAAEGSNGDCRYNLYAISNHSGTTYSGHYTAYCRHPYTHTWHEYNDSRVSSISSKALVSGEAYVLFYELENQKSHL